MTINTPRIVVALDYPDQQKAMNFVSQVDPELCALKVGKELFTREGPQLVKSLVDKDYKVFLDLKFHDIPNTVNKAITAACELGVWMVNVHAMGGPEMLDAAAQAVRDFDGDKPHLIAVSVLTSMKQQDLNQIGITKPIQQMVLDLTRLSLEHGMDGMVCSAQEVAAIRQEFGKQAMLVTPGIRPEGSETNDQHRIMTPRQAIDIGASYLVIGRPITQHHDPVSQLQAINQSIADS